MTTSFATAPLVGILFEILRINLNVFFVTLWTFSVKFKCLLSNKLYLLVCVDQQCYHSKTDMKGKGLVWIEESFLMISAKKQLIVQGK